MLLFQWLKYNYKVYCDRKPTVTFISMGKATPVSFKISPYLTLSEFKARQVFVNAAKIKKAKIKHNGNWITRGEYRQYKIITHGEGK